MLCEMDSFNKPVPHEPASSSSKFAVSSAMLTTQPQHDDCAPYKSIGPIISHDFTRDRSQIQVTSKSVDDCDLN